MDADAIADVIAAENVRLLLAGGMRGIPLPGTLAYRVWVRLDIRPQY